MKKTDLKTVILQRNNDYNPLRQYEDTNWDVVAILGNPGDLQTLIADWERKFRAEHTFDTLRNEFSIGNEKFKITYAREWYV